ncbi:hypothetical protein XA26_16090 [Mycolicibacterium fortuitum]|uniref:Uncharacterized protein n=1 Tax=Mycolicibacterium fortuitum TaxID=1766 RepID=A0A0N9XAB5_MYCFO|nr:hypothetical protein XA26_16090 [Mycolicibacterium fortuitum]
MLSEPGESARRGDRNRGYGSTRARKTGDDSHARHSATLLPA